MFPARAAAATAPGRTAAQMAKVDLDLPGVTTPTSDAQM